MDPLVALLIVVVSVLSVLLVIVGVQVILILKQFHQTLDHLNHTLKSTEDTMALISRPFHGFGDALIGLKSGLQIAETFINWLKENQVHEPSSKK